MKARLFINPASGDDSGPRHLPLINERLRGWLGDLDIVMTVGEGDATTGAAQSVADGYDHLFVAGGDGTLNEVLNGVASVPGGLERTVFGVIPLGTGNDFATALGFPEDVEASLDLLQRSALVAVDLGEVNGRCFINVSGGGFIAEVSDAVTPQLKSIAGKLAYLIGGAQVLLSYEAVHAAITVDSGAIEHHELHAFAVCNSSQVGGGRLIAPDAIINDGLLDVCLIDTMPIVEFVPLLRRVSNGEHTDDERVHYFRARALTLAFDRRIKVNTDGQVLEADLCRYRVRPGIVRVFAPPRA